MPVLPSTDTSMANSSTETQPNNKKNSLCAFFRMKCLALQKANRRRRRGNKVSFSQPPSDTEPVGPQPGPSTDNLQSALSSFESQAVDDQRDLLLGLSSIEPLAVDDKTDLQPGPSSNKPSNFSEGNKANPEPAEETQPKSKKSRLCAFFKNIWLTVQKANQSQRRGSKVFPFQPPSDTEPVGPQPGPSNFKTTSVQDLSGLQPALSSFESLPVDDQHDLQLGLSGLESLAVDNQTHLESALSSHEPLAADDRTDLQLGLSSHEPLAVDDRTDLQLGLSSHEPLAADDRTDLQLGLSSHKPLAVDDQSDFQLGLSGLKSLAVDDQTHLHSGPTSNKPANFEANPANPEPAKEKTTTKKKRSFYTFFKKLWLHKKHNVVNPQTDKGSAASKPNPHTPQQDQPTSEPDPPTSEPDQAIPESEPPTSEPDPPTSEPDPPTSEPVPPTSEPDPPSPEPDPPTSEPDIPIFEPHPPVAEPDSPIPEPVVKFDLDDQTDNFSEDSQPFLPKIARAAPKHKRLGDKKWLRTTASPGPSNLPFSAVYEIGEKLGRGSFGDVFVGIHKQNQQQVAIKFVNKLKTDQYITVPGLYEPMLAEVALNLLLNQQPISPYVAHMIDWFDEEQRYILIMEYSQPSENLLTFISRKRPMKEFEARGLLYQVLLGTKHCLDRGVFHRDIKLNNCVINTETQQVKLIDFGCGELLKSVYVGGFTGGCCPPEYVATLTYRADPTTVWSLGYLMYKTMCGFYPFKSLEDMQNCSLTFPFGISSAFQDLVSRCLICDPTKRITVDDILKHEWFQQMPGAGVSKTS
ncbi:uncharacterized protein [Danio rerio]|uniref:Uncharacterized protein n=1 Tax=Danio rerio TaxID=7955 RepID=A0AC58JTV6_DANRE